MSEAEKQRSFNPTEYSQERLSADYSLGSVGWITLGKSFNKWSYAVRGRIFTRVARDAVPAPEKGSVLDVGPGTGFYLDLRRRLGVGQVTGSDLTPVAVEHLAGLYPTATIEKVDIGDDDIPLPAGAFDAISLMDVLYHLVDDARYYWWDTVSKLVGRHKAIGWTMGAALFPIEPGLTRLAAGRRSPSSTLLVCRRRSG